MVITVVFIAYFLLIAILLTGWSLAMKTETLAVTSKEPMISVIVPVRNEEMTIGNLLTTLAAQEYKNFEIIVVNDDSEDETLWMISRYEMKNLHVIHNKGKGKKAAITSGVKAARGAIVVTTDADCEVPPEWLKSIRARFKDPEVMMAFGGVRIQGDNSFFTLLQSMEFASLIGTGAATAALGVPTMCNGANMSFRKKAFTTVKGYDDNLEIPSGDDEFLMRKIARRFPGSIQFINDPGAVVSTKRQPDRHAFLNQRIRWASKWRYNSSLGARVLAVLVVLFQCAFMVNWILIFTPYVLQALFLISVKLILEAALLLQVCRFLGTPWKWSAFFSLQLLYPPYVVGVAAASFFKPFRWKNRIFKPY